MTARETSLPSCPHCGADPITDPMARSYHTSAAWACGTRTLWVASGKTVRGSGCTPTEGQPPRIFTEVTSVD